MKVAVTGASGFLGQAVVAQLRARGDEVIDARIDVLQFADTVAALTRLGGVVPVIHLAYPGGDGIGDAQAHPASLAGNLLRMDLNVIQAATIANVPKLVCIGSVCAYPAQTSAPTSEHMLWDGYPEAVNASYGVIKRAQLALLHAHRQEFGLNGIHLILPNLYGPGDKTAHVIPALIRRMREAKRLGTPLTVWGAPYVTRSFLYIADAAAGIIRALDVYDKPEPLNLVNPGETSMGELVDLLRVPLNYTGLVTWDKSKPTGHERRMFSDVAMKTALEWQPTVKLYNGLVMTTDWHREQEPEP